MDTWVTFRIDLEFYTRIVLRSIFESFELTSNIDCSSLDLICSLPGVDWRKFKINGSCGGCF